MALGRVLIIAPDVDLRQSLEFLLESEGYEVASRTDIPNGLMEVPDCTILDHRAFATPAEDILAFCRRARPVVLLAGIPVPWLTNEVFRVVQKPLLGEPLVAAVRQALTSFPSARP